MSAQSIPLRKGALLVFTMIVALTSAAPAAGLAETAGYESPNIAATAAAEALFSIPKVRATLQTHVQIELAADEIPDVVLGLMPADAQTAARAGALTMSVLVIGPGPDDAQAVSGLIGGDYWYCTLSVSAWTSGSRKYVQGNTYCNIPMYVQSTLYAYAWYPDGYPLASSGNICVGFSCSDLVSFGATAGVPGYRWAQYCVYAEPAQGGTSDFGCAYRYHI